MIRTVNVADVVGSETFVKISEIPVDIRGEVGDGFESAAESFEEIALRVPWFSNAPNWMLDEC